MPIILHLTSNQGDQNSSAHDHFILLTRVEQESNNPAGVLAYGVDTTNLRRTEFRGAFLSRSMSGFALVPSPERGVYLNALLYYAIWPINVLLSAACVIVFVRKRRRVPNVGRASDGASR